MLTLLLLSTLAYELNASETTFVPAQKLLESEIHCELREATKGIENPTWRLKKMTKKMILEKTGVIPIEDQEESVFVQVAIRGTKSKSSKEPFDQLQLALSVTDVGNIDKEEVQAMLSPDQTPKKLSEISSLASASGSLKEGSLTVNLINDDNIYQLRCSRKKKNS